MKLNNLKFILKQRIDLLYATKSTETRVECNAYNTNGWTVRQAQCKWLDIQTDRQISALSIHTCIM